MIFSIMLDRRKDIQYVKSVCSTCIQNLKSSSYSLLREIVRVVKQTRITLPQITQVSCIFNEYEIENFDQDLKFSKIKDNIAKLKIKAAKDR